MTAQLIAPNESEQERFEIETNANTEAISGDDPTRTDTDSLVEDTATAIMAKVAEEMRHDRLPAGTYRCQFQREFTFRDAAAIAPYLHDLGISHLYASPFLKACTGSMHGYDIVDHSLVNPELGTEEDFAKLVQELRSQGLGHILDFVPNHMGVGSDENAWWQDVLENGPSSAYASFFDVDWQPPKPELVNKILLPVLGDQYGNVLEDQKLTLIYDAGAFFLSYFGRRFPISPDSYARILKHRLEELEQRLGSEDPHFLEYQSVLTAIGHLPPRNESLAGRSQERNREKEIIKSRLRRLIEETPALSDFVVENLTIFNGKRGVSRSFDLLDSLLQDQAYRLSYWQVAADEINYRRFFDVNELAAVCMENPEVFEKTHARVLKLLDEGQLDGLRIDHADGLYSPTEYLWQLQKRRFLQRCSRAHREWCDTQPAEVNQAALEKVLAVIEIRFDQKREVGNCDKYRLPMYLLVEKILEGDESLPAEWPVHGTTGYEFLNAVNGLFVDSDNEKTFSALYQRFIGEKLDFDELVYRCKRLIMRVSMSAELNVLGHQLDRISEQDRRSRDFTLHGLTHALREVVACFSVYRTYTTASGILDRDRQYIEESVALAKRRNPAVSHAAFNFVRSILLFELPEASTAGDGANSESNKAATRDASSSYDRDEIVRFIGRFQQYTGPMIAKSMEDTAFYQYNRLTSLNEVGGDPRRFGTTVDEFHQFNMARQATSPSALSTLATHDTKRGEDTRARINVLTELPHRWKEHVVRWAKLNKRKKMNIDGEFCPSANDEYLLYQTLIGTWPFEPPQGDRLTAYVARIQQFMTKASREAKVQSSWIAPNEAYEKATSDFIAAILVGDPMTPFRSDIEPIARTVAACGIWNSLSQTLLKLMSPGVPDIYQGTELWDFHLVDPDNRAPVDFAERRRLLAELPKPAAESAERAALATTLVRNPTDGRIKLWLIAAALRLRNEHPELFKAGEYLALDVEGERKEHVLAFTRRHEGQVVIVVVPRLTASLSDDPGEAPIGETILCDTAIVLPPSIPGSHWQHVITGETIDVATVDGKVVIPVAKMLRSFPVGLLINGEIG